ncbi:MAG TPA: glycosyltransferase family 4 protein [Burkholderiales bacterium]|nr:glycosyltransferase family 4 protein [Burkholderiales bacterium]
MLGVVALISFVVTVVVLRVLLTRFGRLALDRPNARSLHQTPVPRLGGVGVILGALAAVPFVSATHGLALGLAVALAALSFVDDVRGVPTLVRLACHLLAAGVLIAYALLPMAWFELVLLALAITWMTNLFNFMDGSDGLAGGMACIGFAAYAAAALLAGHLALATVCMALAASAAGFILFNFHPARIFLGDVGSIPLGFLTGALGVLGWSEDIWPLWFPLLVFGLFIGDATLTLLKRLARGERVWQAHRSHYYQRLVQLGVGHRGTALVSYALMLVCAAAALYARTEPPSVQAAVIAVAVVILSAVAVWIDFRWARAHV